MCNDIAFKLILVRESCFRLTAVACSGAGEEGSQRVHYFSIHSLALPADEVDAA